MRRGPVRAVAPDVHIDARTKVPWVWVPQGTPAFDVYYDMDEVWPAESLRRLEAALSPPASARRSPS